MFDADGSAAGDEPVPDKERFALWKEHFHRDLFANVSHGAKVVKAVDPPPAIPKMDPCMDLWESLKLHREFKPHPEREFTAEVEEHAGEDKMWGIYAVPTKGKSVRKFLTVPRDELDRGQANKVSELLTWCLKRWPLMDSISSEVRYPPVPTNTIRLLYNAALRKVCPDKNIVLTQPIVVKANGSLVWNQVWCPLYYVDLESDTMKVKEFPRALGNSIAIHPDTKIPKPKGVSWRAGKSRAADNDLPLDSETKGASERVQRLDELARYECAHIALHYPVVSTREMMKRVARDVEREYTRNTHHREQHREYDGAELTNGKTVRPRRVARIEPPKAFFDNTTTKPFYLTLGSINQA
ncbi:hypothetical protein IMZ48_15140 [Candidatus Bathyarchaeota archaeon]|nr:hypothetical protein [Candidatus Bathyarchaeota archaeon]